MLRYITVLFAVALLLSTVPVSAQSEKIRVISTLQIFSTVVREIGGVYVDSQYIVPAGTDIHDYSLTQKDVERIQSAELVVLANSGFFSIDAKIKYVAHGSVIDFPDYNATILPVGNLNRDFHGYWLYPSNIVGIARAVYRALTDKSPEHRAYFYSNFESFVREVNATYTSSLRLVEQAGMKGAGVVIAVPGVFYVAHALGLNVRALLTSGPNQFVSPEEYAKIKDDINRGSISLVINARNMGDSRAGQIARELSAETGVKIAYVDIFSASNYSSLLLGDAAIISSTPFIEVESGATCDFTPYWIAIAGVLMVAVVLGYMAFGYRRELLK